MLILHLISSPWSNQPSSLHLCSTKLLLCFLGQHILLPLVLAFFPYFTTLIFLSISNIPYHTYCWSSISTNCSFLVLLLVPNFLITDSIYVLSASYNICPMMTAVVAILTLGGQTLEMHISDILGKHLTLNQVD